MLSQRINRSVSELIVRQYSSALSFEGAIVSAINRTPNGQFSPVVDGFGGFLPDRPSRLIHSGNFSTVKFIGGHCTGDGKTFAVGKPEQFMTDNDIRTLVFSRWPSVVRYVSTRHCLPYHNIII